MSEDEIEVQELEIPTMAVEALNAASERALESGRPVVVVQDGKLVRIENGTTVVLRELPYRVKVDLDELANRATV